MDNDKRNRQKPVPSNIDEFLSEEQKMALNKIEGYGWRLEFIRRPLFQEPTVVVFGPDNGQIGVLQKDGTIERNPELALRNHDVNKE